MKVTLISINSINENTGGGIYLRCLQKLYTSNGIELNVICKSDNGSGFKKGIFTDILSRVFFLSPSFLAYYFIKVIWKCKNSDVIAIHSSRLGFYAWFIKFIYPKKKLYVHTDNVEAKLILDNCAAGGIFKKILSRIDSLLIPYSERLCAKWSDKITFITQQDLSEYTKLYSLQEDKTAIVPIYLPSPTKKNENYNDKRDAIIFTGSFDFYPNQDALYSLIEVSKKLQGLKFVVAGRKLNEFISKENITIPDNVVTESDVTSERLQELYSQSCIFLCPVRFGSGMKTKIAEALSYGLYVIANEKSVAGYSSAIAAGVVSSKNNIGFHDEVVIELADFFQKNNNEIHSYSVCVFNENYNLNTGIKRFSEILLK